MTAFKMQGGDSFAAAQFAAIAAQLQKIADDGQPLPN
jgi:hypothetical protein